MPSGCEQNMTSMMKDSSDGLPKQFISSLRILFDILDESRSGFVRLEDIESRWSDDGVRGLPAGVVEGLRKVTPPNGLLSFDKFVAGLKLVLTKKRDEHEIRKPFAAKENRTPLHEYKVVERNHPRDVSNNKYVSDMRHSNKNEGMRQVPNHTGPRQPNLHQGVQGGHLNKLVDHHHHHNDPHYNGQYGFENQRKSSPTQISKSGSMSHRDMPYSAYAIKPEVSSYPSNAVGSHHSPPHSAGNFRRATSNVQLPRPEERVKPPAVPPRTDRPSRIGTQASQMKKSMSGPDLHSTTPPAIPPRETQQNTKILNDLKNWQREWTSNQGMGKNYARDRSSQTFRSSNADHAIYANIDQFQRRSDEQQKQMQQQSQPASPQKATVRRHGSGRRHTLANGIDQNMLKRMKQLEEETSILRSGLTMLDSARDWYLKQLAAVSDKQAMLGKVNYTDNSVEAYQERMNFQRARISEINQHLRTLLESSEKGFPLHMNLAMTTATVKPGGASGNNAVRELQERNRRLLEEMSQKRDQISQLEKEKSSLVRELFEARAKNKSDYDDTTFM